MHLVLKIQEILALIFSNFSPTEFGEEQAQAARAYLAAVARTCRSFKEPALDILWRALVESGGLFTTSQVSSQCQCTLLSYQKKHNP